MKKYLLILLLLIPISLYGNDQLPYRIRIIHSCPYNFTAVGIKRTWPIIRDSDFYNGYQQRVREIETNNRHCYFEVLLSLRDSTLTEEEKLVKVEFWTRRIKLATDRQIIIRDRHSIEQLTNRLNDLEYCREAGDCLKDVYYMSLLDYPDHTDTLSLMQFDELPVRYKGKGYYSRTIFFMVLDLIRDHDPIWREKYKDYYKGHGVIDYDANFIEWQRKEDEEIDRIFNQIIDSR